MAGVSVQTGDFGLDEWPDCSAAVEDGCLVIYRLVDGEWPPSAPRAAIYAPGGWRRLTHRDQPS